MKKRFDLTGKNALVTGSTQGIGKAIARILAENGANVLIHCSKDEKKSHDGAEELKRLGYAAVYGAEDLSERGAAHRLYSHAESCLGNVDILVLNASVQIRRPWQEIGEEELAKQLRVNFESSFELIQLAAPHMCQNRWGRIVTIGSVQQTKPHKDMLVYAASKAAQMSMVQNLAKQLGPSGVTVNNLSPGVIATPRNEKALADSAYRDKVLSGIPCGYAGVAEDCSGAALLLCTEAGRYINGIDLVVDGGMHL